MSELRALAACMGDLVSDLLTTLDSSQRRSLSLDFAEETERTFWDYTPRARRGLSLREMDRSQQQTVTRLLRVALSHQGLNTVSIIMALETILDAQENFTRPLPGRDCANYVLTLFGLPDDQAPWGWRFEGHHVSLHYTISQGLIVSPFPLFLGANPRECELAGGISLRPLREFEDGARDFLVSLDEEQQDQALLTPHAPRDIMMGNRSRVEYGMPPLFAVQSWQQETGASDHDVQALILNRQAAGIEAQALSVGQAAHLIRLIHKYLDCLPESLAAAEMNRIGSLGDRPLHFAWAGSPILGEACYYRIQAPDVLIEFDNYQNDANHVHAVWRNPANDFGRDLLARHYAAHH